MFDGSNEEFPDSNSVERIRSVPRWFDELSRLNLFFSLDSFIHRLKVVNNDLTKVANKQMKAVIFFHRLTFLVLSPFESSILERNSDLCMVFNVADSLKPNQNLLSLFNDVFQTVPHGAKRSKQVMSTSGVRRRIDENNQVTVTVPKKVPEDSPLTNDVIPFVLLVESFVSDEPPVFSYFLENWISVITKLSFDIAEWQSMDIPRNGKFERRNSERDIRKTGLG